MQRVIVEHITKNYSLKTLYDLETLKNIQDRFPHLSGRELIEYIKYAEYYFLHNRMIDEKIVKDLIDTFSLNGLEDQIVYRYLEAVNYGITLKEANEYIEIAKLKKEAGFCD